MSEKEQDTETEGATIVPRPGTLAATTALSDKLMCQLREARAQAGSPLPGVEEVLKHRGLSVADLAPEVLTDLVYAEWMLRLEQGESPSREEYRARFPAIWHRLERQWTLENSLADLSDASTQDETIKPTIIPPWNDQLPGPQPLRKDYIGKYKLISALGSGGQADVYRALHPGLSRDVVIKVIRTRWQPDLNSDTFPPDLHMSSALTEGRLLAQLSHPNIAQIYDVDQENGCPFLVMEYVQGHSLDQYHRLHPLNPNQMARLLGLVARAVAAAHARGILHRDIKPQNIVVRDDGEPRLIDFGLARIADIWQSDDEHPGICGTLGFLPPEQAQGDASKIGPASDVFALGGVLYFLLTGQPLYQGSSTITGVSISGLLERAKNCDWDRTALRSPNIHAGLAKICERALQPDPAARFASATDFAIALEAFARPRRIPVRLTATAVAALLGSIVWLAWPKSPAGNGETISRLAPALAATQTQLKLIIHQDDARIDLADAVPLPSGILLHLESEIPAGVSLMLFSINGEGTMQQVASFPSRSKEWRWRYPEELTESLPLTGPAGTECLLLLGSTDSEFLSRDSQVKEVTAAWQDHSEWPSMAPTTLLRLKGTEVIVEQLERDLGKPQLSVLNPTEKVTRALEQFSAGVQAKCPVIEGVAFSHIEPE